MTQGAVNYGTDISCIPDFPPDGRMVSARTLLGQTLYNRFRTPRGALKDDLNFGHDLEQYLNDDGIDTSSVGRITSNVQAECLKDERVLAASANVTIQGTTLVIVITVTDAQGPFLLVLSASQAAGVVLLQGP